MGSSPTHPTNIVKIKMTYVIQEPCVGVKDTACVEVCPVDCIYETEPQADTNMLPMFIHNEECIDCGACEPECPVDAIRMEHDKAYVDA